MKVKLWRRSVKRFRGGGGSKFTLFHWLWSSPLQHPRTNVRVCERFALRYGIVVCPACLSVTLVYCGQTVGWIKMSLGTEVNVCPGNTVLDGDPAPPSQKWAQQPPTFRPMSIAAKRSPISATAEPLITLARYIVHKIWSVSRHRRRDINANDRDDWCNDNRSNVRRRYGICASPHTTP